MEVTYTCPACGAAMVYDGASGKLHCQYCDLYISVYDYEQQHGRGQQSQTQSQTQKGNYGKTITYHCKSCGAELVADEHTSATMCAFCGNPTLVQDRLDGEFEPDSIIPFKFDKNAAKNLVKTWMSKGILTPSALKKESTIDNIMGVYVPFWLYNYNCTDNMIANATRTRTSSDSKYIYHYTDHFSVARLTNAEFVRIPADASQRMPDDVMDKLEPFEYCQMIPFSMPYLSGYMSEKYNYTAAQLQDRTQIRAKKYIEEMTRETILGYATVTVISSDVNCVKRSEEYALLPVWILNYRYRNENHQLFMNGQTGKIVADRPVSTAKSVIAGILTFAAVFALSMLIGI
ncbi:MAG: hypothetical protein ACI4EV_00205 [Lachnospiraceae bacterium]